MSAVQNIVLVHGAFVDGSGWRGVYDRLTADGFHVRVAQHSTASLAGDVAVVNAILDALDGPAILVGHSYGGVVITEAGNHDKVAGLVYVTAFAADAGESVETLVPAPDPANPSPIQPREGALLIERDQFHGAFAGDLDAAEAAFLADSQVGWGFEAFGTPVTTAAWRSKPSWYLVAVDDQTIPADAQRSLAGRAGATVTEHPGSHAIYISQPDVTADVIRSAASGALADAD